ncbi:hypothetical protein [Microbacterium murale]|uniref:Uncharacterized protein n=1 Tax=Microbacterium murale TaxID=1081040 RepID=A0ABQ1RGT6_9MICO|nr:hypothetical protein [Microbacterium murale]GGD66637.1 hypothetical protein GCM10007269_07320 [Microbacterium murale]
MSALRELAAFFLPVGFVGAGIAVLCAIIAGVALARGAVGLSGGATAVWIVGMMLSIAAGFSGQWIPTAAAGGALVAALVIGALVRVVLNRRPSRPERPEPVGAGPAPTRPRRAEGLGGASLGTVLVQR